MCTGEFQNLSSALERALLFSASVSAGTLTSITLGAMAVLTVGARGSNRYVHVHTSEIFFCYFTLFCPIATLDFQNGRLGRRSSGKGKFGEFGELGSCAGLAAQSAAGRRVMAGG